VLIVRTDPIFSYSASQSLSRSQSDLRCAAICVYDDASNVIETHEHAGEFKEW
jgi:hypothetical protein